MNILKKKKKGQNKQTKNHKTNLSILFITKSEGTLIVHNGSFNLAAKFILA